MNQSESKNHAESTEKKLMAGANIVRKFGLKISPHDLGGIYFWDINDDGVKALIERIKRDPDDYKREIDYRARIQEDKMIREGKNSDQNPLLSRGTIARIAVIKDMIADLKPSVDPDRIREALQNAVPSPRVADPSLVKNSFDLEKKATEPPSR